MKKLQRFLVMGLVLLSIMFLTGCFRKSLLKPNHPVSLNMWHVYGEQVDSPMNRLIDEFNQTLGREKGIIVNVTLMSNASDIGSQLLRAQANTPGLPAMPDLFFCHRSNVEELGADGLIDWKQEFSEEEREEFVPDFIEDGLVGDKLSILPVSKSTHVLYIAGTPFARFSAETGVSYESLSTWDGFFAAAEKYYDWSGGKPFCAIDYLLRCVDLNALEHDAGDLYTQEGWYDFDNAQLKAAFMPFAKALVQGHIVVSDLYSNTQVMTGEVVAGIGSTASILYYNDTITYPNGQAEPMQLQVLPIPKAVGKKFLVTQAGVGLCGRKTTEQKIEAATIFARWLTESERNMDFCVETGYMPVKKDSFAKIQDQAFPSKAYQNLYQTLATVNSSATAIREASFPDYFSKVHTFYEALKKQQGTLPGKIHSPEDVDKLAAQLWELFRAVK